MRVSRTEVNQLQYCSTKLANGANYRTSKLSRVFVIFHHRTTYAGDKREESVIWTRSSERNFSSSWQGMHDGGNMTHTVASRVPGQKVESDLNLGEVSPPHLTPSDPLLSANLLL